MNDRAEAALHEILSIPIQFVDTGDKNAPLAVLTDPALIKIKQDVAKFVVERLCPEAWSPQRRMRVRINAQHPTVDPAKKALGDELIRSYLNQEHCECCSNKKTFAA
ncbi:hypothetical protein KBD13_02910 [Patescibacteria group bacterium]|nr:hypothetical protein [Patescibacteria group bacterium]